MILNPFLPGSQPALEEYRRNLPKRPMHILVACEFSGRVRDRFIARGHDAVSCDLLDTDSPGPHIKGDVVHLLRQPWDLIVAFPPCTFVTSSQLWRCLPHHDPEGERWHLREEALRFNREILNTNCPRIAMENPVGCISTRLQWDPRLEAFEVRDYHEAEAAKGKAKVTCPPAQIVQPFEYGNPESKSTCLWLKGLPLLTPTNLLDITEHGYYHEGEKCWRWQNQTGKGGNKLGENKDKTRWKIRSLTYSGIADAIAETWSLDLTKH